MDPAKKSELLQKRKADYWKLRPFVLRPNLCRKCVDVTDDSSIESGNSVDSSDVFPDILDRMEKERP